ncbi:MAG: MTH938/NDUFAF3 family protein [Candidatus Nanoarchaeia archaeon]
MIKIDNFIYGCITINGKDYKEDVYIFPNGTITTRKCSLEGKTHLEVSADELTLLSKDEPEAIIIGTGKHGGLSLSQEAINLCREKGIKIEAFVTQKAANRFNWYVEKGKKVAGLFHITD